MRYLKTFFLIIFWQLFVGCTNSHEFGPYQGKVVDKETLKPLEGAVVFVKFTSRVPSVGGDVRHFADAVETLTDKNGEFYIPVQKLTLSGMFRRWDEFGDAIIFKPGYGAFPKHRESAPKPSPFYSKSPQGYVTIQLPKLHSIEERKRNLPDPGLVPEGKIINFLRLECIESKGIGLTPILDCCEDDI